MRKFLLLVVLSGGLIFAEGVATAKSMPTAAAQSDQQAQATKSVNGTIVSIGGQGQHSFAVEVNDGGTKETMQFVVDKDTKVAGEGQVKVGSSVKVDYVAMADENLAKTITTQG